MEAVIIILSVLSLIFIILYIAQRRQIKKICRQMAFVKDNKSNLIISDDTPLPEVNELAKEINRFMDKSRRTELLAEKREAEMKATITNLSHDIRTPLTSLDGYFQLLSQAEAETERERYTKIIQERIKSLKDILEELFTYTKLQNTDFELTLEELDVVQTACRSVFTFYDDFKNRGIEPEINMYDGPIKVCANDEGLLRVFHNVIKNALEHSLDGDEGNFVDISIDKVRDLDNAKYLCENVVFKCSNRVKSADKIDVDRVFDRFYKSDNARTSASTGLGLSISKELVQRMNGEIRADISEDIFTIEIRLKVV